MENNNSISRRDFIKLSSLAGCALLYAPMLSNATLESNSELNSNQNHFFEVCKKGELDLVKKLIYTDKSLVQIKDETGRSGFTIALVNNHLDIGTYLKTVGYKTDLQESVLDKDWDRYNELYGDESEESTRLINE